MTLLRSIAFEKKISQIHHGKKIKKLESNKSVAALPQFLDLANEWIGGGPARRCCCAAVGGLPWPLVWHRVTKAIVTSLP